MKSGAFRTMLLMSLAVALVTVTALSFKLSAYRITTGSMAPDFPIGTIVVASGLIPPSLHHAVTFVADGKAVTHVLVGYNKDGSLITRGIANAIADHFRTPVYPRDVRGQVLVRILLFAPAFWLSLQGAAVAAGLCLLAVSLVLWFRTMPASGAARSNPYRRTESSA